MNFILPDKIALGRDTKLNSMIADGWTMDETKCELNPYIRGPVRTYFIKDFLSLGHRKFAMWTAVSVDEIIFSC